MFAIGDLTTSCRLFSRTLVNVRAIFRRLAGSNFNFGTNEELFLNSVDIVPQDIGFHGH